MGKIIDASRFSLEQFRLDSDKIIIGIKIKQLVFCLFAATFSSPEKDNFSNFKII